MRKTLAFILAVLMTLSLCSTGIVAADTVTVTFADEDGVTVFAEVTVDPEVGLEEIPVTVPPKSDGYYSYSLVGWSDTGTATIDPLTYAYTEDITFKAVYKQYGVLFEDPQPVDITNTEAEINLMPENVPLNVDANGVTWIYKVEGAESTIIADCLKVGCDRSGGKKTTGPATQWNDANYSYDSKPAYHFELNNGYYFLYVNDNLNNMNAQTADGEVALFSIYGVDLSKYPNARTPVNTNEAASVTVLGVIPDNLKPTVTFYDAQGELVGSYTHAYTNINTNLGYGANRGNSCRDGSLLDAASMFDLSGLPALELAEDEVLLGWAATPDGAVEDIVDAVYTNMELYPVIRTYTSEDVNAAYFKDYNGDVIFTGESVFGKLLSTDYPTTCDKPHDGVYSYGFDGWSVDGVNTVNPLFYNYEGDVTFTPVYTRYGVVYDDPTPIDLTYAGEVVSLLPEKVAMGGYGTNGITFAYKVEGVQSEIIADDMWIVYNGGNNPAWQWADLGHNVDGMSPSNFELNNGYFYIYQNGNISGTGHGKGITEVSKFTIYNPHKLHAYNENTARDPKNDNTAATFTMLAVIPNNLQPTLTFHDEDGNELISYKHSYSNVTKSLGYQPNVNSQQEGNLLTPAQVFELAMADNPGLAVPEKESDVAEVTYKATGWKDADGNIVEAVYENNLLYPEYETVDMRTKYTVKFMNYDGTLLEEHEVREGVVPVYEGFKPRKPSTDKNSYTFTGWDKAVVATPTTPEADAGYGGEIVYTAQFEEHERRYDVEFFAEDTETKLAEVIGVKKGEGASADIIPTKEADVQYTYEFEKWVTFDGEDVDLDNITTDLKLKPAFKNILNKYTVTYVNDDMETVVGTEEVEYGTAAKGMSAEKAPSQWFTYEFDRWVDAQGADADLSAVVGDITVYAAYEDIFTHNFKDVDLTRFYGEAVEYVVVNGIMQGTSTDGTTFSPESNTSRAQLVTVLYRLEGQPDTSTMDVVPFDDVSIGKYYTKAVTWAYNTGVVNGVSDTEFAPNADVTREQFATILYRYADEIKDYYVGYGKASLMGFQDKNSIGAYAQTPIKWAIATENDMYTQGSTGYAKEQYITGVTGSDGKLYMNPKSPATRAQMATMLYRFMTSTKLLKSEA